MEANAATDRLRELRGSGYEIVDGQPDIIGWTIKDNFNFRIGVVDDLLFDPALQKVRYIIAHLKNNELDLDKRKVLIPIGLAELHESNDDVILSKIAPWQLRALPTYSNRMTDYDEHEIFTVFTTGTGATLGETNKTWQKPKSFYEHPSDNQDTLRKRRAGDMKDAAVARTVKPREITSDSPDRNYTSNPLYDTHGTSVQEPEAEYASHRESGVAEPDRSTYASDSHANERVLNKIKRMHEELDELERDIRSGRGV